MTIRTLSEFAAECRKTAGSKSISGLKDEIARLRAENLVLARAVAEGKYGGELQVDPSQVAGVLMCNAVEIDATEIEKTTGMIVGADVGIDDEKFDVYVRLWLKGDPDEDVPEESAGPLDADFDDSTPDQSVEEDNLNPPDPPANPTPGLDKYDTLL